jgi:hypothetical protein
VALGSLPLQQDGALRSLEREVADNSKSTGLRLKGLLQDYTTSARRRAWILLPG